MLNGLIPKDEEGYNTPSQPYISLLAAVFHQAMKDGHSRDLSMAKEAAWWLYTAGAEWINYFGVMPEFYFKWLDDGLPPATTWGEQ